MQLPQTNLQRAKAGLHVLQALLTFVGWVLIIAIFTKGGSTSGGPWWYFALAFISIPFLVYQCAVPIFPRTQRFASIYAFAIVDILFSILWLSAFAAVAAYMNSGIHAGENSSDNKDHTTGCAAFSFSGYGPESKCTDAASAVGVGVVIFFAWLATAAISVYSVMRYRRDGVMPGKILQRPDNDNTGYEGAAAYSAALPASRKDEVWNADADEHDDFDEHAAEAHPAGPLEGYGAGGSMPYGGGYSGLQQHEEESVGLVGASGDAHPGRQLRYGRDDHEAEYDEQHSAGPFSPAPPQGETVPFPVGNYDGLGR